MKIKKDSDVSTSDFWYDLTAGGYLDPVEICESEEDARRVIDAIAVVKEFQDSCEEQIDPVLRMPCNGPRKLVQDYRVIYGQSVRWGNHHLTELWTGAFNKEDLYVLDYDPRWVELAQYSELSSELNEVLRMRMVHLFRNTEL